MMKRTLSGFTLIELMVTLSVLVILLTLAVPSFQEFIRGQRVKTTSFDVFAALTFTRSEALKRNGDVTITPVSSNWSNGWNITSAATTLRSQASQPTSVVLTGPASITFGRDGRANANTTIQVDANPSAASISSRCISIDLSGRPNSKKGTCV